MRSPKKAKLRGMRQTSTAFSRFSCKAKTEKKKLYRQHPQEEKHRRMKMEIRQHKIQMHRGAV